MANKLSIKCDVCGSWFWCGRPCGRAPVESATIIIADVDEDSTYRAIADDFPSVDISTVFPDVSETYKYRDPEKRRAYMKEYMRKRRAKAGGQ